MRLIVTGTDTGVGKTIVSAALAKPGAAYVKPAQTGDDDDAATVKKLSGADVYTLARYPDPLAPATAARRAGLEPITPQAIADFVETLTHDLVIIEGAGGLLVRFDEDGGTLADAAAVLGAPVLVVARAGLGTLNAVALTCEALRARDLVCAGVVVGAWPAAPDLAARCNLDDLPVYAGAPLLGRLPAGAAALGREAFLAMAHQSLNPTGVHA